MKNKSILPIVLSIVFSFAFVAVATYAASTISTNISTEGTLAVTGVSTLTGAVYATSTLQATATTTLYSDLVLGNAVADTTIVNGRISTGSLAGTALTLGATYPYGEGTVLRYNVSDWTGIGTDFAGFYVRTSPSADASGMTLNGAKLHAANGPPGSTGYDVGTLRGAYIEAETKPNATTVTNMRGLEVFTGVSDSNTAITNLKGLYVNISTAAPIGTGYGIHVYDGTDVAGEALAAAIYVSNQASWTGYVNGLDLSGATISTADIVLQNSETIDNKINGVIRANAVFSVNGFATTTVTGVMIPVNATTTSSAPATCNSSLYGGIAYTTKGSLCVCQSSGWSLATSSTGGACAW